MVRIEEAARKAQQEGDFSRSISLWTRLNGLRPEHWEYLLGLALDLRMAGRVDDSEEVFRRAALAHPDCFWLVFHWSLAALTDGRLDLAEQRARKLQDRFAHQREAFELLGDIAFQQRDMRSAERHLEAALSREPDHAGCMIKRSRARMYRQISEPFPAVPVCLPDFRARSDYGVLVINLDGSPERLARAQAAFRDSPVPIHRVPGVRGSYLPTAAFRRFAAAGRVHKGTLGTFLAHAAAWETMLALDLTHCLIVEDDAVPVINLPSQISALGIPEDFDLCFVNERMQHQAPQEFSEAEGRTFSVYSPIEVVESWPDAYNTPGADGYLLSASGARKLLEFVARDGFAADADWRLLGYSIAPGDYSRLRPDSVAFYVLRQLGRFGPDRLTAYSLFPCLIRTSPSTSDRSAEDAASEPPAR